MRLLIAIILCFSFVSCNDFGIKLLRSKLKAVLNENKKLKKMLYEKNSKETSTEETSTTTDSSGNIKSKYAINTSASTSDFYCDVYFEKEGCITFTNIEDKLEYKICGTYVIGDNR